MTEQEFLESGQLELYVAGSLTEEENLEVKEAMERYALVRERVLEIEASLLALAAAASPGLPPLQAPIEDELAPEESNLRRINPWRNYVGWAAALVLAIGLVWLYQQNQDLRQKASAYNSMRDSLEQHLSHLEQERQQRDSLLALLRNTRLLTIPLAAQEQFPGADVRIYWDQDKALVYLDASNLPVPPAGKVYQLWSLKLDPLTPTSLGTLDEFNQDADKLFAKQIGQEAEAFGITLEPAGGSQSPTMDALYRFGIVKNS